MDNRDTDTISRYAVIDALGDTRAFYFDSDKGMVQATKGQTGYEGWYKVHDVFQTIDNLPPSPSRPPWIPCTERLPEHKGDYLVTFKLLFTYPVEVCYFDGQAWDKGQYDDVLAWMPKPEPYQGM